MAATAYLLTWVLAVALGSGTVDALGNVVGEDFSAFHTAARLITERPETNAYLTEVFVERQRTAFPARGAGDMPFWLNPPNALLLYAPLSVLPYPSALAAWWALQTGGWVLGLALVRRTIADWPLRSLLLTSAMFLPTLVGFTYGQSTALAFGILVAAYALLRRGAEVPAGAVLALLAFKPQLALGLALPLVLRARWRALLAGGVVLVVQIVASHALWPTQWRHFFETLPAIRLVLQLPQGISWGIQTLAAFWQHLLGGIAPPAAAVATWCTTLLVLGVLARAWQRILWDPDDTRWQSAMASTLVLGIILSPHLWIYDLGLLLLPFWIVVGARRIRPGTQLGGGRFLRHVTIVWLLSFGGSFVTRVTEYLTLTWLGAPVALQLLVPVLLYVAWCIWPREDTSGVDDEVA